MAISAYVSGILNNSANTLSNNLQSRDQFTHANALEDIKAEIKNLSSSLASMQDQNTAETFKFNHDEAVEARKWEKEMSDTSHQREVSDLKAAGLNPVLSINNGANSYSTQSASASADNSGISAIGNSMSTYLSTISNLVNSAVSEQNSRRQTEMEGYIADKQYDAALLSSAATKYAADKNKEASKYAADTSYKGTKYSSDQSYRGSKYASDASMWNTKYSSDKAYASSIYSANQAVNASKYASDKSYQATMDRPSTNAISLIDKYLGSGALRDAIQSDILGYGKGVIPSGDVKNRLQMLGIKNTTQNRQIYRTAVKLHDKKSLKKLNSLYAKSH